MTGWQAGPVSCCSAAVARHTPFLEHSMAVSQHLSPKAGQAGGWSPGLGDHSCCHSQHSHSLPGSGHMTCVTQVASPTLCGDDSEARLAEATWEESSGLRAHASPHPLSCGAGWHSPGARESDNRAPPWGCPPPTPTPSMGTEKQRPLPPSFSLWQPKRHLVQRLFQRNPAQQQPGFTSLTSGHLHINTCLPLKENDGHLMPICSLSKRQTDISPPEKSEF